MFGRAFRKRHMKLPEPPTPGEVHVGFPAGQAPSDVLQIAIWNHYGTRTIPERPFLDNAMRANRNAYRAALRRSAKSIVLGETSTATILNRLGLRAQGDIQNEITDLQDPPNAPSTIRQKGSSNPLIDTGRMRGAVTYEVKP